VESADLKSNPKKIKLSGEEIRAKAIIIATGAAPKLLGLEAEKKLMGRGVSTCATCDGAFFKGADLVVVGGGDSAIEESTFLTKFAKKVYVVHRRNTLRASKIMQERAFKNAKIEFIWDSTLKDILDVQKENVEGVILKNLKTGQEKPLKVDGVFIAIGHVPNSAPFRDQIECDDQGYIFTKNGSHTNVPGVFAAGDCVDHVYRQAITAAGMGCMAALDAERYLESLK
jgi:thioredoxin reductase (NADPH)